MKCCNLLFGVPTLTPAILSNPDSIILAKTFQQPTVTSLISSSPESNCDRDSSSTSVD